MRTEALVGPLLLCACATAPRVVPEPPRPPPKGELSIEVHAELLEREYLRVAYAITNVSAEPATVLGEPMGAFRDRERYRTFAPDEEPFDVYIGLWEGRGETEGGPIHVVHREVLDPGETIHGAVEVPVRGQQRRQQIRDHGVRLVLRLATIEDHLIVSDLDVGSAIVHPAGF